MLKIVTKITALALAATALCSNPAMAFDVTPGPTVSQNVAIGVCQFEASYTGPNTAMVALLAPSVVPVVDNFQGGNIVSAIQPISSGMVASCLGGVGTVSNFSTGGASGSYAQEGYIGFSFDYIDALGVASVYEVAVSGVSSTIAIAVGGPATPLSTSNPEEELIMGFMLGRADSLAANQPGLMRFLNEEQCGALNADIKGSVGSVDGCISRGNTWAEVTGFWADGGKYTLGTIGSHRTINPNFIIGGMLQFDHASYELENPDASLPNGDISGHGWMVGPYFAAKLRNRAIFLEGRLLYGQTDNNITFSTPAGTYSDDFKTERMLAQFRATGKYQVRKTTLMPLLDITYTNDTQKEYVNTLGYTIDKQSVDLMQLTAGMDFSTPINVQVGTLAINGGVSGIYSASHGPNSSYESIRGRVELGLDYTMGKNGTLTVSTFYDGIGSRVNARGITLGFDARF